MRACVLAGRDKISMLQNELNESLNALEILIPRLSGIEDVPKASAGDCRGI